MNNYQWLLQMDGADRKAWFDAEHVETEERALDGDTAPENADSREKLEADIKKYRWEHSETSGRVTEWLDRQAAITEEQTRCKWVVASADEIAAWRSKAEKLQAQVYELTAERDNLADELLTANRQREQYRKLFGMALDWAHEITMLESSVDEGMA